MDYSLTFLAVVKQDQQFFSHGYSIPAGRSVAMARGVEPGPAGSFAAYALLRVVYKKHHLHPAMLVEH